MNNQSRNNGKYTLKNKLDRDVNFLLFALYACLFFNFTFVISYFCQPKNSLIEPSALTITLLTISIICMLINVSLKIKLHHMDKEQRGEK